MLQRYFRNVGILGATEVVLRLRGLVLMPILTKAYGAVNYGIWAQVSLIVSIVGPLIILGTDSAVMRFLPGQTKQEIRRGFSTLVVYYTVASAGVALLLWLVSSPVAAGLFEDAANAPFVVLCGGMSFTTLMTATGRRFYQVIGNAKALALINLTQSLYTAGIAVGVAISGGTIFELVLLQIVADLVLAGVLLVLIAIRHGLAWPDWAVLARFIRFGLPLVPAGYAMWVLNLSDRLFITRYGTLADIGIYGLVYGLGYALIALLFNPIWTMYPPSAAELYNQGRLDELSNLFRHSTRLALGLMVPAVVGMSALSVPLIRVLATEEFVRGAPLIPAITLGYTLLMLAAYFDVALYLVGRQVWSTISIGIAAGVNLMLNAALIPTWGITGAAVATALSFGTHFCITCWMGSRCVRMKFDWGFLAKTCLAASGMRLVLWVLPAPALVWGLLLDVSVGAITFGVLMVLLRALQPREWEVILGALHLLRWAQRTPIRYVLNLDVREDAREV